MSHMYCSGADSDVPHQVQLLVKLPAQTATPCCITLFYCTATAAIGTLLSKRIVTLKVCTALSTYRAATFSDAAVFVVKDAAVLIDQTECRQCLQDTLLSAAQITMAELRGCKIRCTAPGVHGKGWGVLSQRVT